MTKIRIEVKTYSGYQADERPTSIIVGGRKIKVEEVIDRWYGVGYRYFKVKAEDGYTYILNHETFKDEWELVKMEKE